MVDAGFGRDTGAIRAKRSSIYAVENGVLVIIVEICDRNLVAAMILVEIKVNVFASIAVAETI